MQFAEKILQHSYVQESQDSTDIICGFLMSIIYLCLLCLYIESFRKTDGAKL